MLVDKRLATTLLLVSGIILHYVVAVTEKASQLKEDQEKIEAFLKFSKLLESENTATSDTDDEESGSGTDDDDDETHLKGSTDRKFHHINATFLLLKEAQQLLNKTAAILPTPSKRRTKNNYDSINRKTDNSPLMNTNNKVANNAMYTTSNQGFQSPNKNTWSYRPTLQIANITYQGFEKANTDKDYIKYKHHNKNGRHSSAKTIQSPKKLSKGNNTRNYVMKGGDTMLITKKQLNTQYIEDGKFNAETLLRDFKAVKLTEKKEKHKNRTKEVRGPSAIDIVKAENLTDVDSNKTDKLKNGEKPSSQNFEEPEEQKLTKESIQDSQASKLQELLSKLKFNNGVSSKVKAGQEFAYISQCGLYTEPQNVSMVQHAWVTKTYSPYFYLYEKPKKYEKCKPSAWMNGTDIRGSVFLSFEVKSLHGSTMENNAKICEKYCCKEPRCAAWVLRLQSDATSNCPADSFCCWLKTDVPKPEPHDDCVSGIVHRDHYKHPPNGMRSAVPLGGLGTGSFELRADGTFHEWTIENQSPGGSAKLSKTSLEMMLLGLRIKKGDSKPHSAVVRTHAPHGFDSVDSIAYSGAHPVSRLKIDISKQLRKDVDLTLYAYSAFHPRSPKASATPAVIFTLDVKNPSTEDLDISFMMNLPFGYNDDTIRRGNNFAEIAFTRLVTAADCQNACAKRPKCMSWTTNGPFSCMLKDGMPLHAYEYGIISGLKGDWSLKDDVLNCKRPGFYAQSGEISLYPVKSGSEVISFAVEDDPESVWEIFKKTGHVSNVTSVNTTGLNGAVSISTKLKPKQKKILTIIMAWYFPNRGVADERVGNFYNNLYKSSVEVAKHAESDLTQTLKDIIGWQSTFTPPLPTATQKEVKSKKPKGKQHKCASTVAGLNILPDCLQDILSNSLSTLRTGMWMENGRWRQWEAFDCANLDPVHVDFHRIIPYVIVYPEIAKQVMLAWADHQLENGMIQESLSMGCLEETSKEGVAGGRLMADVNVGFIVQAYLIYSWTNDTSFFDEIYPFTVRAMEWLIKESTKGTGLPYRKPDTYDLFELEKYDHCAYNSFLYLLALNAMKKMAAIQKDTSTLSDVTSALERGEKQLDVEMWDDKRDFYHAWFDIEWGSPAWLMSDVLYAQVWAYTLGIGELVDKEKLKKHLKKEEKRNDSPFGLKAITKSDKPVQQEDTSVILGDDLNSCKSLENITKSESIWMTSSTDWSTLQLHLGVNPKQAMEQASKSLDNYRSNLRDQWNIHGLTSSKHYGLDGLPWATSHYTFHLMLWHLPLALSGQQYNAPTGKLTFNPRYEAPYWLPFYTPQCMGNIEAKEVTNENVTEIMFGLKISSGTCKLRELSISDSKYGESDIVISTGETIKWSTPKKTKKDIVKAMLDQLKHR